MGVRVKPLVWRWDAGGKAHRSDGEVSNTVYLVWEEDGSWVLSASQRPFSSHLNLELAKAAAQADYEARILSALIEDDGYVTVFPPLKQSEGGE